MKIVHCCLSNFYIDGYAYQENELAAQNVRDGHDVTIIASTESLGSDGNLIYIAPSEYLGAEGAKVIRLPYRKFLPFSVMRKLRMHNHLFDWLNILKPDIILFHGTCGWELITVARYKKLNPDVKFYVDSHEDFNNSARGWISKWLLHYSFYRNILKFCLPEINKILCVTVDSISFVSGFYEVPAAKVELFPLGGQILDDVTYAEKRSAVRQQLGAQDDAIVLVQSGKLDASKQLVSALLAFAEIDDPRLRFVIAGVMSADVDDKARHLIKRDGRVQYLGWLAPVGLRDLLCAADVYVQPFGQTVTTQMSLCCRCAIVVQDLPSHRAIFHKNGVLTSDSVTLATAFRYLVENAESLEDMRSASSAFAEQNLNYQKLAQRICG